MAEEAFLHISSTCLDRILTLETNNQTNNESLPKLVQTDNASCSIKTAIHEVGRKNVCVPSGMLETIIRQRRTRVERLIFDDRLEGSKMTGSMLFSAFCPDTPIVEGIYIP